MSATGGGRYCIDCHLLVCQQNKTPISCGWIFTKFGKQTVDHGRAFKLWKVRVRVGSYGY